MKRRSKSPISREKKKRKNLNKLDRETSRLLMISTKSSKPDNKRSRKEEFSSNNRKKDMLRIWRSRLSFIMKKWKRSSNLVLCNKKKENSSTIRSKKKLKKERENFSSI